MSHLYRNLFNTLAIIAVLSLIACKDNKTVSTKDSNIDQSRAETTISATPQEIRLTDLKEVNEALEAFHEAKGYYPSTQSNWVGSIWVREGLTTADDWLPELSPVWIPSLPIDPSNSKASDGPQYIYASDGVDYKLIAYRTGDCELAMVGPVKVDPRRKSATGCFGYGYWTDGYKF
jgi:hypothetical protein